MMVTEPAAKPGGQQEVSHFLPDDLWPFLISDEG